MKDIPLFNNLFRQTVLPSGMVLSKPFENKTKELLLATKNRQQATNVITVLIKHIIAAGQKEYLARILVNQELSFTLQTITNNMGSFTNEEELLFVKLLRDNEIIRDANMATSASRPFLELAKKAVHKKMQKATEDISLQPLSGNEKKLRS